MKNDGLSGVFSEFSKRFLLVGLDAVKNQEQKVEV